MKRIFQFGSILLAAYLIALPILVGIHAEQHSSHHISSHHPTETVIQASDCGLCDLYQNQAGILEIHLIHDIFLLDSPDQKFTSKGKASVELRYISLRGPPAC